LDTSAAQAGLGEIYEFGQGVEVDYEEAAKWFRRAAGQGKVISATRLGAMLFPARL
jgi:TPR repeat protein